jgi:tetratricopeptide (TPR) repeat protein
MMESRFDKNQMPKESLLETFMRFTPATIAFAVLLTTVSSVGIGQKPDSQIAPLSLQWLAKGDAARAAGAVQEANDAYESALAVDPRNRRAFIALAEVARGQGLQGKALRMYDGALTLNPADMDALGGSVQALVEKGAIVKARENLSKMKTLCRGSCPQIAQLDALIEKRVATQAASVGKEAAVTSSGTPQARQP